MKEPANDNTINAATLAMLTGLPLENVQQFLTAYALDSQEAWLRRYGPERFATRPEGFAAFFADVVYFVMQQ